MNEAKGDGTSKGGEAKRREKLRGETEGRCEGKR